MKGLIIAVALFLVTTVSAVAAPTFSPPVPSGRYELVGVKARGYYPKTNRYVIVTGRPNGQTGSCYVPARIGQEIKTGAQWVCKNINRQGRK